MNPPATLLTRQCLQCGADRVGRDPLDPDRFQGRGVPDHDDHIPFAKRQQLREEGRKGGVGLSLFRRRCDGDSRPPFPLAQESRSGSAGHDFDRK